MNIPKGKLFALVAVFAAIGLVTATGAFTTVTAERTADVSVAGDASALVAINAGQGSNANEYFTQSSGTAQIDLSSTSGGQGVNLRATTSVKDVFTITNQGSQAVTITLTQSDLNNDGEADDSATEQSAVRFAVPQTYDNTYQLSPKNSQINDDVPFAQRTLIGISHNGDNPQWDPNGIELDTGETIQVGIYIDTSSGADFNSDIGDSSVGNLGSNPNSDDLIDTITVHASADQNDNAGYAVEQQSS